MDYTLRETRILAVDDIAPLDDLAIRAGVAKLDSFINAKNWFQRWVSPRPQSPDDRAPRKRQRPSDGPYRRDANLRLVEFSILRESLPPPDALEQVDRLAKR